MSVVKLEVVKRIKSQSLRNIWLFDNLSRTDLEPYELFKVI